MPEEVCKILGDQYQYGELFDPNYEYLIKEQIHREIFQEKEDLNEQKETLISILLLEEEDFLLPCFPPTREVEEEISLNDEEIEDLVEPSLASILPTHEGKETFILGHVDGLMGEDLDTIDENIDTFIQIGRRRWDFDHLIFYKSPI
jgi:hypothetical protein